MYGASAWKPPGSSVTVGGAGSSSGGLCSILVDGIVTCSGASVLIMGSAGGWIGAGGVGSWISGRVITFDGSGLGPGPAELKVGPNANTAKWRTTAAMSACQTQARDCRLKRSLAVSWKDEPGTDAVDMGASSGAWVDVRTGCGTPSAQKASYPSFMQTTPDVGISSNLSSERLARHARRIVVNDAASSAWTIATTSESCSPSSWQNPP